jgi:hypothetical protein
MTPRGGDRKLEDMHRFAHIGNNGEEQHIIPLINLGRWDDRDLQP